MRGSGFPDRAPHRRSAASARLTNPATVAVNSSGRWRFQRWVASGTIRSSAPGMPSARRRESGMLARSLEPQSTRVGTATRPRRARRSMRPISRSPATKRALAAAAEILLGGRDVLGPAAGVHPGEHAHEQWLRRDPAHGPLQREPARRVGHPGREHEAAHRRRVLQARQQRDDRPTRDADEVGRAAGALDRAAYGRDGPIQRERPFGGTVTGQILGEHPVVIAQPLHLRRPRAAAGAERMHQHDRARAANGWAHPGASHHTRHEPGAPVGRRGPATASQAGSCGTMSVWIGWMRSAGMPTAAAWARMVSSSGAP